MRPIAQTVSFSSDTTLNIRIYHPRNFKVEFDRATGRAEDAFYLKFCQYFENREDDALEEISDADEVVRDIREELQTWTYKYDVCGAAIALAFDRLDNLEARARALDTASLQTSNSKCVQLETSC